MKVSEASVQRHGNISFCSDLQLFNYTLTHTQTHGHGHGHRQGQRHRNTGTDMETQTRGRMCAIESKGLCLQKCANWTQWK